MPYATYGDLKDKCVFITGGGSGIGAAMVKGFMAQNAKVAFVCNDNDGALALCEEAKSTFGISPIFNYCDITNVQHFQSCIESVIEQMGKIDVLINNAANDARHSLDCLTDCDWDLSLNTNLRPHFFSAQSIAPVMAQIGGGSIINMSSNSALLGLSGYPAYVSAKAGIIGLSKALARELGPSNIRVNSLIPGWVMTEKQKKLWATEEAVSECIEQQCLKHTIEEDDIVNAALFLASDASRMMTAQALIVDGGRV